MLAVAESRKTIARGKRNGKKPLEINDVLPVCRYLCRDPRKPRICCAKIDIRTNGRPARTRRSRIGPNRAGSACPVSCACRPALAFVEDHASACTDPGRRRRTGRNQDLLQCDETEMKPFSGFHEGMVKPPAVRKGRHHDHGGGEELRGRRLYAGERADPQPLGR